MGATSSYSVDGDRMMDSIHRLPSSVSYKDTADPISPPPTPPIPPPQLLAQYYITTFVCLMSLPYPSCLPESLLSAVPPLSLSQNHNCFEMLDPTST